MKRNRLFWLGIILASVISIGACNMFRGTITYSADVAPIINEKCVIFHYEGGPEPFKLTTYESVVKKASTILKVLENGYMPLWLPDKDYSSFLGERYIEDQEFKTIRKWVESGCEAGDLSKLARLPDPGRHHLGEPDAIIKMEHYSSKIEQNEAYRIFVLPHEFTEDKLISAIEFVPGNAQQVHHAWIIQDTTSVLRKEDAKTEAYGIEAIDPFIYPVEIMQGYLPGSKTYKFPDGTGQIVHQKGDLAIQVHYFATDNMIDDQSELHIYFTDEIERMVTVKPMAEDLLLEPPLDIPANAVKTEVLEVEIPYDISLFSVAPHMHYRGKKVKAFITDPNGKETPLIRINDLDFNWQGFYHFEYPLKVVKGSKVRAEATYDNTDNNISNPVLPPVDVFYGDGSLNEMCQFVLKFVEYREGDELISSTE